MTTINGTDRGETLPGTSSADSIKAFDSDDFLSSGGGNDTLLSGDFLDGGSDEGVDSADYRSFKTNGVPATLAKVKQIGFSHVELAGTFVLDLRYFHEYWKDEAVDGLFVYVDPKHTVDGVADELRKTLSNGSRDASRAGRASG